jgi:hypothetical protein
LKSTLKGTSWVNSDNYLPASDFKTKQPKQFKVHPNSSLNIGPAIKQMKHQALALKNIKFNSNKGIFEYYRDPASIDMQMLKNMSDLPGSNVILNPSSGPAFSLKIPTMKMFKPQSLSRSMLNKLIQDIQETSSNTSTSNISK